MPDSFRSFTPTWHNDTYASIDVARRSELSVQGKAVVVSGGGTGIGKGIASAFAEAGAASVALLGRRLSPLHEAQQEIESKYTNTKVTTHSVDVVDSVATKEAAERIGKWDVLISNAGYCPSKAFVADSDPHDWWKGFEINVKGTFNLLQALIPTRNKDSTIISINAGSIQVPAQTPNLSGYNSSKFATAKLIEAVAAEYPDIHAVTLHPGIVETDLMKGANMWAPHMDTVELPAHFAVWLCSEEAKFLRGRFVWSNWDVEELKARKKDIEESLLLTANCVGWPYEYTVNNEK